MGKGPGCTAVARGGFGKRRNARFCSKWRAAIGFQPNPPNEQNEQPTTTDDDLERRKKQYEINSNMKLQLFAVALTHIRLVSAVGLVLQSVSVVCCDHCCWKQEDHVVVYKSNANHVPEHLCSSMFWHFWKLEKKCSLEITKDWPAHHFCKKFIIVEVHHRMWIPSEFCRAHHVPQKRGLRTEFLLLIILFRTQILSHWRHGGYCKGTRNNS